MLTLSADEKNIKSDFQIPVARRKINRTIFLYAVQASDAGAKSVSLALAAYHSGCDRAVFLNMAVDVFLAAVVPALQGSAVDVSLVLAYHQHLWHDTSHVVDDVARQTNTRGVEICKS